MEKHDIGTDATHAEHIETIKERHYAHVTPQNFFAPLNLGIGLVEGYDSMGYKMSKPNLRRILEEDLKVCVTFLLLLSIKKKTKLDTSIKYIKG